VCDLFHFYLRTGKQLSVAALCLCISNVQLATRGFLTHLCLSDDVSAATATIIQRRVIHRQETALYVNNA